MANELQVFNGTGTTVYALIRARGSNSGKVWDVANGVFAAYATANLGDYDVPLTEQGVASQFFVADMPGLTAGTQDVDVVYYQQAGGSPAETDTRISGSQFHHGATGWESDDALSV